MLEEINKYAKKLMHDINNRAAGEFEGYSPFEMHHIIYDTYGSNSPIQILDLNEDQYKGIPILNHIKFLAKLIGDAGELKLTAKGNLPPKVVVEIYNQGFYKNKYIESGIVKLRSEEDSMEISLLKILLLFSGLVKKRNNKLSITKSGAKILNDNNCLLKLILETFCSKYNWAYCDLFGDNKIGQLGHGFSVILLNKYGSEVRSDRFYADKYFHAFPDILTGLPPESFKDAFVSCYSVRTFDRFLKIFGLIDMEKTGKYQNESTIKKSALFDQLIKCLPHRELYK